MLHNTNLLHATSKHTLLVTKMLHDLRVTLKEIVSQTDNYLTDYYLVSLSSKAYVFEDKMTKY